MKQLIQSLALIALFGSVSHLSLGQEVKQVKRAEKNYIDNKKIENKELQTPRASDKTINSVPAENATPNQVKSNEGVVQTVSVGTRRAVQTPVQRIKEIDAQIENIDSKTSNIRENSKELKIAEEENWFEKMEQTKKELIKEKELLQKELMKKN